MKHCMITEKILNLKEMDSLIEEMNKEELTSILEDKYLVGFFKKTKEKPLYLEYSASLLSHYCFHMLLKNIRKNDFSTGIWKIMLMKMIIDEEKKEENNEKLLTDLSECYLFICDDESFESEVSLSTCVSLLLKCVLCEEKRRKTQKEVERALLALSNIPNNQNVMNEQYLNEIKEIIKQHQQNHNLTQLSYQSAWKILINSSRFTDTIVANAEEFHFVKEATIEMKELIEKVDWTKKEKELDDKKEICVLRRWCISLESYFQYCQLQGAEGLELFSLIIIMCRVTKNKHREIFQECLYLYETIAHSKAIQIEDLASCGAVDYALEEILCSTLDICVFANILRFFDCLIKKLNGKENDEKLIWKKSKREKMEKLEEEGFEDTAISVYLELFYDWYESYSLRNMFNIFGIVG
eukprot:MONOS_9787.1-p1 / transcript=MONOS_9787.1 / gene=MONOS_9787 / organism=Monocercomonoides_exilis_PA203 / gene_product=unspecified product / transcript_product=unspecified product / location=Mono_scaffold00417:23023-24348(+) / protein_length=411 / sequence_SO=supercontig / SO=protein_coding / is_pseudo=false